MAQILPFYDGEADVSEPDRPSKKWQSAAEQHAVRRHTSSSKKTGVQDTGVQHLSETTPVPIAPQPPHPPPPVRQQRRKRHTLHVDCINTQILTARGTKPTKPIVDQATASALTRRARLVAVQQLTFSQEPTVEMRRPQHETPLQSAQELQQLRRTMGFAQLITPDNLHADAVTGVDTRALVAMKSAPSSQVLPLSDWHVRFNSGTPAHCDQLYTRLLQTLYGYEEAMFEARVRKQSPRLNRSYELDLYMAMLDQPDWHEAEMLQIGAQSRPADPDTGVDAMLDQPPLPNVCLMRKDDFPQFFRPPRGPLERECSQRMQCVARSLEQSANVGYLSELQQPMGHPRQRVNRDPVQNTYTLREWMPHDELKRVRETGQLPERVRKCVVCEVSEVNVKFFSASHSQTVDSWQVGIREQFDNALVDARRQLDAGTIDADRYRVLCADAHQRYHSLWLRKRYHNFLPFKVAIGAGEFPENACLNIRMGDADQFVSYPFPMLGAVRFRWKTINGDPQVVMHVAPENF